MSRADVQSRIDARDFSRDDLVWFEGAKRWKSLFSSGAFRFEHIPPPMAVRAAASQAPASPPASVLPGLETAVSYAGFWRRFLALIIDWLICILPAYAFGYVIGVAMYQKGTTSESDLEAMGNVLGVLIWWLYFAVMESSPLQACFRNRAG